MHIITLFIRSDWHSWSYVTVRERCKTSFIREATFSQVFSPRLFLIESTTKTHIYVSQLSLLTCSMYLLEPQIKFNGSVPLKGM